jgi:hypothetical protein
MVASGTSASCTGVQWYTSRHSISSVYSHGCACLPVHRCRQSAASSLLG